MIINFLIMFEVQLYLAGLSQQCFVPTFVSYSDNSNDAVHHAIIVLFKIKNYPSLFLRMKYVYKVHNHSALFNFTKSICIKCYSEFVRGIMGHVFLLSILT